MRVLLTGATGYIGGRLVGRLLDAGHQVRVLVRDPKRVANRPWVHKVDVKTGDLLAKDSLKEALEGVDGAYYLVHSMLAGENFHQLDCQAANNFVEAGQHLRQVVYLGGLLPPQEASLHLSSRAETGEILRKGLKTTEFRAGPIVGAGSASFELVRYIAERIPVLPAPRGIANLVQPIAVDDMIEYLVRALDKGEAAQGVVDVGGDRLSFGGMLQSYAEVRGLKRPIVEVPLLTPAFCAWWAGRLTPVPASLAAPLLEGVRQNVVADTTRARTLFPEIQPQNYKAAVERALVRAPETSWREALGARTLVYRTDWEGLYREVCSVYVPAPPEAVFREVCSLGGDRGWVVWNWAWKLRGWMDQWVGGPGLRRGRRHPTELLQGEALDVWRAEAVEPPRLLRLQAEMKLPGRAWLQFETTPEGEGTRLTISGLMEPHGVPGWLYWWGTYPFHRFFFRSLAGVLSRLAVSARKL